jgi:hypothetical protein
MGKVRDPSIHLQLGHLVNRYPHASVERIYKTTRKEKIIGSINTLWSTLEYMEKNRIIDNPRCVIKNFKNYTNMHYVLKTDDWKEFTDDFFPNHRNSIDMVHCMNAYGEAYIYVKTHSEVPLPGYCQVLEKHVWNNFIPVLPHSITREPFEHAFKSEPKTESTLDDFYVNENLEWTDEIWETYYWISVNYRMTHSVLARILKTSPQTAYRRRMFVDKSVIVHYPLFIGGWRLYEFLFLSFETKYPSFFIDILKRNSGVSYVVKTDNSITLFINTTIPGIVEDAMDKYEETGIIRDMRRMRMYHRLDPLLEDYKKGLIPEKHFWMFKIGSRKRKRI